VLYHTEWVNPRPHATIEKVVFTSTHMPVHASPILIAMTGVEPTEKDVAAPEREAALRDVALITPIETVGKPIDMTDGVNESDRVYRTKDGIVVEAGDQLWNPTKSQSGCDAFWSRASSAVFDNKEYARCVTAPGLELKVTLPTPRKLTGLALTCAYREEKYVNDFPPSVQDYIIEATSDGRTWVPVTQGKVVG
jgi:hypothetical protein